MIKRRALLAILSLLPVVAVAQQPNPVATLLDAGSSREDLRPLKAVIVARDGEIIAEIVDANGRSVFGDEDDKLPSAGFWPSEGPVTEGRAEARSSSDDES